MIEGDRIGTTLPADAAIIAALTDPIIAAAIARHGHNGSPTGTDAEGKPVIDLAAHGDAPRVRVSWAFAMVRWPRNGLVAVQYEFTPLSVPPGSPPTITIADTLPDTLLHALTGRPLAALVMIEGDPGMTVNRAWKRAMGKFVTTIATLNTPSTKGDQP